MTRPHAGLALALALFALPAAAEPMSEAERLLFVEPHLRDLRAPATLRYHFVKAGSLEAASRDEMQLDLHERPGGGCCEASGRFVGTTGGVGLPPIEDAKSNPVVLYFLERDVREMQRLTRGQPNHFRRRIRLALADAATLRDTTIRHRGRELPAVELRVTPYAADPARARFERLAGKQYVFVLAAGVPGGVVQLRTRVPGASPADPPLLEETLTLADASAPSLQPER